MFPWLMLLLSASGGLVGSFTHEPPPSRRQRIGRHLILGVIFGLVFWMLVELGAVTAIPKSSIALGQIAALNEIGAFLLGFIGGYGGNALWTRIAGV